MAGESKTGTNVLLTLGLLFAVGGAARMIPHNADAAGVPGEGSEKPEAHPAKGESAASTGDSSKVCFTGDMAARLEADQLAFDKAQDEMQTRELELQAWERELKLQTQELATLQSVLDERWETMVDIADDDIQHLARMYSSMKPDQAATIFNQMDPGFAAGFFRMMPSDQGGLVLAAMDADKAYEVSLKLAAKNADIRSGSGTK